MTETNTKELQYVSEIHKLPKKALSVIKKRIAEAQDAAKDTAKVNAYLSLFHGHTVEESSSKLEYFATEKDGEITTLVTFLACDEYSLTDVVITVYVSCVSGERFVAAAALLDTVRHVASLRNMASLDVESAPLKARNRNAQALTKRLIKAANEATLFNNWECCK